MRLLWITPLLFIAAGCAQGVDVFVPPGECLLTPDPGNCGGSFRERWFFSAEAQECRQFGFSGCQGNANNFDTVEDCMTVCMGVADTDEQQVDAADGDDDDISDEFEVPLNLINNVDKDESFSFSKSGMGAEDLSALQEVVSEMQVSAMQAREAEDYEKTAEEPLDVPKEDDSVSHDEDVKTEEPQQVETEQGAEVKETEDDEEDEGDVDYDPKAEIRMVSEDPRFSFVQDNIREDDMSALQEMMSQMNSAAMQEVEEVGEVEHVEETQEDSSAGEAPVVIEEKTHVDDTENVVQEHHEEDDEDDWFSPMDTINSVDEEEKYSFRKGPMTPEDLDTLQELVSQMETGAMEEEEEEVEDEDPHPLSYLPDETSVNEDRPLAKVSAEGMNSNNMDVVADTATSTQGPSNPPIVTTKQENMEIITTSVSPPKEGTTTQKSISTTDSEEQKLNMDGTPVKEGFEEPMFRQRPGFPFMPNRKSLKRVGFMMPPRSPHVRNPGKPSPFKTPMFDLPLPERMQKDTHPPMSPPSFLFNSLVKAFSNRVPNMPSREELKKVLAERFGAKQSKEGLYEPGTSSAVKRWPIMKIFMAHLKPKPQVDADVLSKLGRGRRPETMKDLRRGGKGYRREEGRRGREERRPPYSHREEERSRPRMPDFRMEDSHHGYDEQEGRRPWGHKRGPPHYNMPKHLNMYDGKHLNNVSPKNKFTLLQVFVNKKSDQGPQNFPMKQPYSPHNQHRPMMPQSPLHLHHLMANTIPPYHPEVAPNTYLNYHPFYPHMKPTLSNQPPWRSIPFSNQHHHEEEKEVIFTTESAEEPEQPSYACLLPLDAGMCKTYQVRWYFNKYRQRCELFFFGGCGGNANRFDTMHDCKQICSDDGSEVSEQERPASGEVEEQIPLGMKSVKELLEKEAARRAPGETLVVTSPVYVDEVPEESTTPPAPPTTSQPDTKAAAEEELQKSKDVEVVEEIKKERTVAESYVIAGLRSESRTEFVLVIVIMSVVGLAVVILIAVTVSHFMKKMNSTKKERVLEAVIKSQMCADLPKMVYSPAPPTLPADVIHTPQTA